MTVEFRVISMGALASHPLRGEKGDLRPSHLTTTLLSIDDRRILVDPSLPGKILVDRLQERGGVHPGEITDVFLSSFRPEGRRGLELFEDARWLVAEREREAVGVPLVEAFQEAQDAGDHDLAATVRDEIALLQRCEAAPDSLAEGIDLFPLPGVTPGLTGLLLALPQWTIVIASDGVPTIEHLEAGQVLGTCADITAAQESLREVVEIADLVVPGRDGLVPNPLRQW
jgi:glyoxylase-like metal-dependent hydrolase (beta-lactamase superfamily II)